MHTARLASQKAFISNTTFPIKLITGACVRVLIIFDTVTRVKISFLIFYRLAVICHSKLPQCERHKDVPALPTCTTPTRQRRYLAAHHVGGSAIADSEFPKKILSLQPAYFLKVTCASPGTYSFRDFKIIEFLISR